MRFRALLLMLFVALLFVGGAVMFYRAEEARERVEPATVRPPVVAVRAIEPRSTYQREESFYGWIEAQLAVDMKFKVPGQVEAIGTRPADDADVTADSDYRPTPQLLRTGDRVRRGDVLMQLEQDRFEVRVRSATAREAQARAQHAVTQANADEAAAMLKDFETAVKDAEIVYTRRKELRAQGVISEREYQQTLHAYEQAQARLTAARSRLEAARQTAAAQYQEYLAAREQVKQARIDKDDSILVAPWDAVIAHIHIEVGDTVSPAQTVTRLIMTDSLKLVLGIPQNKIDLFLGQADQQINIEALPHASATRRHLDEDCEVSTVRGEIVSIAPEADPHTRLFRVEVAIANTPDQPHHGRIRPGMIARAIVPGDRLEALAIPAEAARLENGTLYAMFATRGYRVDLDLGGLGTRSNLVLDDTWVVRRVPLEQVRIDKDQYLVRRPPQGMDWLVLPFMDDLEDGQPVRLMNDPSTPAKKATARQRLTTVDEDG